MKSKCIYRNWDKNGFSLIELLVYITIVSIFITGAVIFTWDVIYGREKSYKQQITEQNAKIAILKIENEIKKAKNIQSISNSQIILNNTGYTTTINLNNGKLQITSNGKGPYDLTSNQVMILQPPDTSEPVFKSLASSDNATKHIAVSITARQIQSGISQDLQAQTTIKESVELPGQFNQARSLLIDGTNAQIDTNHTDFINLTIGNSGSNAITIDKMIVSWSGDGLSNTLSRIRINGTNVWTGSASSGTMLDITNKDIPTGSGTIPINFLRFSGNMQGSILNVTFIMTDGSLSKVKIDFS